MRLRTVFVTGLGALSAAGVGKDMLLQSLEKGELPSIHESYPGARGVMRDLKVARIPRFGTKGFLSPQRVRRLGPDSVAPVIATVLADRDAVSRGASAAVPPERKGIFLGTGFGPLRATGELLYLLAREGPEAAEPFLFIESLHQAPVGHAALVLECRGPTLCPLAGDASAVLALIQAARLIEEGRADRMYAGGWEGASPFLLSLVARLLPPDLKVPLLGEGAVVFRLDSDAGSGRPYARIAATGVAHDPSARRLGYGTDPDLPRGLIASTLSRVGWRKEEIEFVVRAENGLPGLSFLEEKVYFDWPDRRGGTGPTAWVSPMRALGAFAGSGGFAPAAAVLLLERSGVGRALVCAPAWGGGCHTVGFSGVR